MSLMGTLTKLAVGYAAARGVDKLSGGGGLQSLLGGGARVPASDPTAQAQAQMTDTMTTNPMAGMMEKLKESGLDLGALTGGGAAGGANPMADIMQKMQSGGLGGMLGGLMGGGAAAGAAGASQPGSDSSGGLLSSMPGGGAGLAGILAAVGGAAALSGQGAGKAIDQMKAAEAMPQAEDTAGLMLRAMIQAAKSDGEIDEAERAKILETLGDDADASDIAFVQAQLAAPIDAAGLASDTPDALKPQVYAASLMTIRVDTQAEAQYLDQLAKAMGLTEPMVNTLHLQMGQQPLYG